MRLVSVHTLALTSVLRNDIPPYAILSHTWESFDEELSFQDLSNGSGKQKNGYRKITFCAQQAIRDGIDFMWIDSVCIDRTNNTELAEAINSMFRWYRSAQKCYVYLSDVSGSTLDEASFRSSRHHTRGWTLQEIIAPQVVEFFSKDAHRIGDKVSLEVELHQITGIDINALRSPDGVLACSNEARMSWSLGRQTTIEEDQVYCLLGIFGVYMPLIYGEGKPNALHRLRNEINAVSVSFLTIWRFTMSTDLPLARPCSNARRFTRRACSDLFV